MMNMINAKPYPFLLMNYIGRQFFMNVVGVMICLSLIVGLFDLVELFRRASGKEGISALMILQMAFYKLPSLIEQLLPLMILFGGLISFSKLAKSRELVIARSVGVSVWQILATPFLISLLIGAFIVIVFNPISTKLFEKFDGLENSLLKRNATSIEISATGIWLRDVVEDRLMVMNAKSFGQETNILNKITLFKFDENDSFLYRVEATSAQLQEKKWLFSDAKLYQQGRAVQALLSHYEPTNNTTKTLEENFIPTETLSFWELQDYIKRMKEAGFRTVDYQLKWHGLLASPFLFGAMALIAAIFTLRSGRSHRLYLVLTGGMVIGFILFLLTHIMNALGLSQILPVLLAGWIPTILSFACALSMLLHLEDG